MRTDRPILMNTLSPDPICKRYQMRMRWRGILAGLALEALAASPMGKRGIMSDSGNRAARLFASGGTPQGALRSHKMKPWQACFIISSLYAVDSDLIFLRTGIFEPIAATFAWLFFFGGCIALIVTVLQGRYMLPNRR